MSEIVNGVCHLCGTPVQKLCEASIVRCQNCCRLYGDGPMPSFSAAMKAQIHFAQCHADESELQRKAYLQLRTERDAAEQKARELEAERDEWKQICANRDQTVKQQGDEWVKLKTEIDALRAENERLKEKAAWVDRPDVHAQACPAFGFYGVGKVQNEKCNCKPKG